MTRTFKRAVVVVAVVLSAAWVVNQVVTMGGEPDRGRSSRRAGIPNPFLDESEEGEHSSLPAGDWTAAVDEMHVYLNPNVHYGRPTLGTIRSRSGPISRWQPPRERPRQHGLATTNESSGPRNLSEESPDAATTDQALPQVILGAMPLQEPTEDDAATKSPEAVGPAQGPTHVYRVDVVSTSSSHDEKSELKLLVHSDEDEPDEPVHQADSEQEVTGDNETSSPASKPLAESSIEVINGTGSEPLEFQPAKPQSVVVLPDMPPLSPDAATALFAQAEQVAQQSDSVDDLGLVIRLCEQAIDRAAGGAVTDEAKGLCAWAYNRRGELHLGAQRESAAQKDFQAAVEIDPGCWQARHNRAVSFAQNGETEAALAEFNRVIALRPAFGIAYRNRAELLAATGRTREAIADYNRAIEQFPANAELRVGRGHAHHRLGNYKQALADFEAALRLSPKHAEALTLRGNVYAELGAFERAVADFRAALEQDPQHSEAYRSLAWLTATCPDPRYRDPEQATESAERAMQYGSSGDFFLLETLAAAQASAGQFNEAAKNQRKAIAVAPTEVAAEMRKRLALYEKREPYFNHRAELVQPASFDVNESASAVIDDLSR